MIKSMVGESLNGVIVENIKEIGKMVNSMESKLLLLLLLFVSFC